MTAEGSEGGDLKLKARICEHQARRPVSEGARAHPDPCSVPAVRLRPVRGQISPNPEPELAVYEWSDEGGEIAFPRVSL